MKRGDSILNFKTICLVAPRHTCAISAPEEKGQSWQLGLPQAKKLLQHAHLPPVK